MTSGTQLLLQANLKALNLSQTARHLDGLLRQAKERAIGYDEFILETYDGLLHRIDTLWDELGKAGFDLPQLLSQSILMPATCALMNPDGFNTVESAYDSLKKLSRHLQTKYNLA